MTIIPELRLPQLFISILKNKKGINDAVKSSTSVKSTVIAKDKTDGMEKLLIERPEVHST